MSSDKKKIIIFNSLCSGLTETNVCLGTQINGTDVI